MKLGPDGELPRRGLPDADPRGAGPAAAGRAADGAELAAQVVERGAGRPARRACSPSGTRCPIAAASIGQVHRAITHDDRAVAVKVQYPGVDEAIRADLDNTDLLFDGDGDALPGLRRQAARRGAARPAHRGARLPASRPTTSSCSPTSTPATRSSASPRSSTELSTERVLTTELADGARFAELDDVEPGGARPGRRGDLPLRVPQPLPAARVQRRPASRQLPVPARRAGDVPRLRPRQALQRRARSTMFERDDQGAGPRPATSPSYRACSRTSGILKPGTPDAPTSGSRTTSATSTIRPARRGRRRSPRSTRRRRCGRLFDAGPSSAEIAQVRQPARRASSSSSASTSASTPCSAHLTPPPTGAASPRRSGRSSTARRPPSWGARKRRGAAWREIVNRPSGRRRRAPVRRRRARPTLVGAAIGWAFGDEEAADQLARGVIEGPAPAGDHREVDFVTAGEQRQSG